MSICEIALGWMPQNTFDEKSALVQVMVCCCQATSHYLSKCCPRWMSSYGVARSLWITFSVQFMLPLTHWGWDKMAAISQTTLSSAFSWKKMSEFRLRFVPKGPINNNPALVQIMAWHRSGDKPLSEPMMVSLLTHICVTRPQWVNGIWITKEVMNDPNKWLNTI